MKRVFLILFLSLLLTACGQSGPLYLPKTSPNTISNNKHTQTKAIAKTQQTKRHA